MTDVVQLGALADSYHAAKTKLKTAEARLEPLRERVHDLEVELLRALAEAKATGARGRKASVTISNQLVPTIEDWSAFEKFVISTKSLDLLQRRVSTSAWRERLEAAVPVPGVVPFSRTVIRSNSL